MRFNAIVTYELCSCDNLRLSRRQAVARLVLGQDSVDDRKSHSQDVRNLGFQMC